MSQPTRVWRASYVRLARSGELGERARSLDALLDDCTVCPRECRVDRRRELGECATGADAVVASWNSHHGEEPVISCRRGSGTVFLANCNLRCVFCQNHDISQRPPDFADRSISDEELAAIFIDLQDRGCHNLNWVSPSHQVPQLVRALEIAAHRGLSMPVVYNSNGFDSVKVLRLLDGVVDIYMPDLKYAQPGQAAGCRRSRTIHATPAQLSQRCTASSQIPGISVRRESCDGDCWCDSSSFRKAWAAWTPISPGSPALSRRRLPSRSSPSTGRATGSREAPISPTSTAASAERSGSRRWLALEKHMEGDRHHVQQVFLYSGIRISDFSRISDPRPPEIVHR